MDTPSKPKELKFFLSVFAVVNTLTCLTTYAPWRSFQRASTLLLQPGFAYLSWLVVRVLLKDSGAQFQAVLRRYHDWQKITFVSVTAALVFYLSIYVYLIRAVACVLFSWFLLHAASKCTVRSRPPERRPHTRQPPRDFIQQTRRILEESPILATALQPIHDSITTEAVMRRLDFGSSSIRHRPFSSRADRSKPAETQVKPEIIRDYPIQTSTPIIRPKTREPEPELTIPVVHPTPKPVYTSSGTIFDGIKQWATTAVSSTKRRIESLVDSPSKAATLERSESWKRSKNEEESNQPMKRKAEKEPSHAENPAGKARREPKGAQEMARTEERSSHKVAEKRGRQEEPSTIVRSTASKGRKPTGYEQMSVMAQPSKYTATMYARLARNSHNHQAEEQYDAEAIDPWNPFHRARTEDYSKEKGIYQSDLAWLVPSQDDIHSRSLQIAKEAFGEPPPKKQELKITVPTDTAPATGTSTGFSVPSFNLAATGSDTSNTSPTGSGRPPFSPPTLGKPKESTNTTVEGIATRQSDKPERSFLSNVFSNSADGAANPPIPASTGFSFGGASKKAEEGQQEPSAPKLTTLGVMQAASAAEPQAPPKSVGFSFGGGNANAPAPAPAPAVGGGSAFKFGGNGADSTKSVQLNFGKPNSAAQSSETQAQQSDVSANKISFGAGNAAAQTNGSSFKFGGKDDSSVSASRPRALGFSDLTGMNTSPTKPAASQNEPAKTTFAFGKPAGNAPAPAPAAPAFGAGVAAQQGGQQKPADSGPKFAFGQGTTNSGPSPAAATTKPPMFGGSTMATQPTESRKTALGLMSETSGSKPSVTFGNQSSTSTGKPPIAFGNQQQNAAPAFGGGNSNKPQTTFGNQSQSGAPVFGGASGNKMSFGQNTSGGSSGGMSRQGSTASTNSSMSISSMGSSPSSSGGMSFGKPTEQAKSVTFGGGSGSQKQVTFGGVTGAAQSKPTFGNMQSQQSSTSNGAQPAFAFGASGQKPGQQSTPSGGQSTFAFGGQSQTTNVKFGGGQQQQAPPMTFGNKSGQQQQAPQMTFGNKGGQSQAPMFGNQMGAPLSRTMTFDGSSNASGGQGMFGGGQTQAPTFGAGAAPQQAGGFSSGASSTRRGGRKGRK